MSGLYPAFKYAKRKSAVIKFRMEMKDNSYSLVQSCPERDFQVFGGKKKNPNCFSHVACKNTERVAHGVQRRSAGFCD